MQQLPKKQHRNDARTPEEIMQEPSKKRCKNHRRNNARTSEQTTQQPPEETTQEMLKEYN